MKIIVQYRDGENFKDSWEHEAPDDFSLEAGDEFTMGEHGTQSEDDFFRDRAYPYDPVSDHNILEVLEILN